MNPQKPFFSIIIPCFNAVNFIDKALNEFNKQAFTNLEVICVDDCSRDNTFDYLKSKEHAYRYKLVVVKNDNNVGPGRTRSHGLDIAKGEYICFCDCDDWFVENALTTLYNKLIETEADLCFFDVNRVVKSGKVQRLHWLKHFNEQFNKAEYIAHATDSLWSIVVKRGLISSIKLPTSYNCEDGPAVVAMTSIAKKIAYINQPLYCYYYRENSLSTTINPRILRGFIDAYHYMKSFECSEYAESFEIQYIKCILYGYTLNAIKLGKDIPQIYNDVSFVSEEKPNWTENPYIKTLPLRKRFWIWAFQHKLSGLLKLYLLSIRLYYQLKQ